MDIFNTRNAHIGRLKSKLQGLNQLAKEQPSNAEIILHAADCALKIWGLSMTRRSAEQAIQFVDRAIGTGENQDNPDLLLKLAEVLRFVGDFASSWRLYSQILDFFPRYAKLFEVQLQRCTQCLVHRRGEQASEILLYVLSSFRFSMFSLPLYPLVNLMYAGPGSNRMLPSRSHSPTQASSCCWQLLMKGQQLWSRCTLRLWGKCCCTSLHSDRLEGSRGMQLEVLRN